MSLRIALLGMLASGGPASGYDLTKSFDSSINFVWQAKHSQIYPELAKLVDTGAATVEDTEDGRGRKIYTITEAGRSEVVRWLTTGEDPKRSVRNATALRAFLIPVLDPPDAASVMRAEAARHGEALARLEGLRAAVGAQDASGPVFGSYALDLGIRSARMLRDWALDAADDLEERASSASG